MRHGLSGGNKSINRGMALWNRKPSWLGKLGLALLATWLFVLIVSVFHVFKDNSLASDNSIVGNKENLQRLAQLTSEFEILKKQNEALANIVSGQGLTVPRGDHSGSHLGIASCSDSLSGEYEELRRRVRTNVQEMWYYVHAQFNNVKKKMDEPKKEDTEMDEALKMVWEHKKTLINDLDKLTKADGHDECREKEAKDLSDLVQKRFRYLQNPSDCNKAKKLICSLNKGCGFGCQIHHLTYCFLVAYGTERTLILKSRGWRYHKDGWASVFKPLSDNCFTTSGDSHSNWPGDSTKQVITLPIVDSVYPKPKYQPPGIPADLAPRIERIHGSPLVWWVGQVLKYLLRPQDNVKKLLEDSKKKLGFKKPIVGVHVRRTDKVGTEAAFHDISEYMTRVEQYFDQMENPPSVRRVFVATDDPKVITNARGRYPNYEIIGDPDVADTASVSRRYTDSSLFGIIVDINLLSQSDYLVCTFSSQVCRLAYEFMQNYHIDAYDRFASLDDTYYYGGQNYHNQIVIHDHKPRRTGEIELRVNDLMEVFGNHWDGFSKGRNTRTGMTGLFPSFKVRYPSKIVEFPRYNDVDLVESKKIVKDD